MGAPLATGIATATGDAHGAPTKITGSDVRPHATARELRQRSTATAITMIAPMMIS
ncbi:MAG: hypothetical protein ACR2G5_15840 [Pyrinomonadaceae bacterium]